MFSNVDCIVVPSIWGENSPLVIHEAQSCKIPVITAEFGGMKEYVQHNVNGLLFKHRCANSLAEQLKFAVLNAERMKELGAKGYLYSADGSVHKSFQMFQSQTSKKLVEISLIKYQELRMQ